MGDINTEVAVLKSELKHVSENVDKIEGRLDTIDKSLAEIKETLAAAKGGWKALIAAGTAGGAVVAIVAKVFPKLMQ